MAKQNGTKVNRKSGAVAARESRAAPAATADTEPTTVPFSGEPEGSDPWPEHHRQLAALINARRVDEVDELSAETEILQAVFELREWHDDDGIKKLRDHARSIVLKRTPFTREQVQQFNLLCAQMEGLLDVEAPIPTLEDWYRDHAPTDIDPDDLVRRNHWRNTGEKRIEFMERWRYLIRGQLNPDSPLSGPERHEVAMTLAMDFAAVAFAWLPDGIFNREWPITRELRRAGQIVPGGIAHEANIEKVCSNFEGILGANVDRRSSVRRTELASQLVNAGYRALGGRKGKQIGDKLEKQTSYGDGEKK